MRDLEHPPFLRIKGSVTWHRGQASSYTFMTGGMRVESMLNRRTFLKTGLTTGAAALPLAAALEALDPASAPADAAVAVAKIVAPKLMTVPARLAHVDPATEPWQQEFAEWDRAT
jgi:TAT (twin-arginine translocation) pathway signal sequence